MADEAPDRIAAVLDPALRRPFSLIVAVVVSVGVVIMGLSKAEDFVDGRVELKMQAQREKADEQRQKLAKMEEQFLLMRDTLAEIRADVRVLRSRIEGSDAAKTSPR
jgi:uncharacterized membrane-anchored protein YhcB (DUF1043 family)